MTNKSNHSLILLNFQLPSDYCTSTLKIRKDGQDSPVQEADKDGSVFQAHIPYDIS